MPHHTHARSHSTMNILLSTYNHGGTPSPTQEPSASCRYAACRNSRASCHVLCHVLCLSIKKKLPCLCPATSPARGQYRPSLALSWQPTHSLNSSPRRRRRTSPRRRPAAAPVPRCLCCSRTGAHGKVCTGVLAFVPSRYPQCNGNLIISKVTCRVCVPHHGIVMYVPHH